MITIKNEEELEKYFEEENDRYYFPESVEFKMRPVKRATHQI